MAKTKYGKRRNYRRYRKKGNWFNTSKFTPESAWSLAKTAAQDIYYLKGLINSEQMKFDTSTNQGQQSKLTLLNAIAQGDAISNRHGNSILVRNITMKGQIAINTAVAQNTRVMIALVLDTQQIGDTNPALGDIFQNANDPHTLLNSATVGRFKILKRWQYSLSPVAGGNNIRTMDFYKSLYFHTRYNGTGTNDIQKNGLYLAVITSESTNFPQVDMNVRIGYYDN